MYSDYERLVEMAQYYDLEISENVEDLRQNLLDFFHLKIEVINKGKQNIVLIKNADIVDVINDENRDATVINLTGNIYISVSGKVMKGDFVTIDLDNQEIIAIGNVVFIDNNSTYYASKIIFHLPTQTGLFYDVRGKIDNYWINAAFLQKIDGKTVVGKNIKASTCDQENMHYYILSGTFFYSEEFILSLSNTLFVGQTMLFWFPIFFSMNNGYGFPGDFGFLYQKREGFMFFNTFPGKDSKIMIDVYERLGIFAGYSYKISGFELVAGLGYSTYLFYDSTYDIWTTYNASADINETIRELRYGFQLSFTGKLFDRISYKLSGQYYSDVYFVSDFLLKQRKEEIVLGDIFSFYYPNVYPYAKTGLTESLQINIPLDFLSVNLTSGLYYKINIIDSDYLYTPGYAEYNLSWINLYNVSLSTNSLYLKNDSFSLSTSMSGLTTYTMIYDNSETLQQTSETYNFSVPLRFTFNIPGFFSYSFNANQSVNFQKSVNEETEEVDQDNDRYSLTLSNSLNLNLDIFSFSMGLSQSYLNYFNQPDLTQWNYSKLSFGCSLALFYSTLKIAGSTSLNLLDEETNDIFSYNIENWSDIKLNITFSANSDFGLSFQTEYNWLYDQILYTNLSSKVGKTLKLFNLINFTFSEVFSYYDDFLDDYNDKLTNSFVFSLNMEDQFKIYISVTSNNYYFYTYNSFLEIMNDLLRSFNFFDIQDRIDSYFNLQSISITFARDLHRFTGYFSIYGYYVLDDTTNTYQFKVVFTIGIQSIDLSDLKYEDVFTTYYSF